MGHRHGAAHLAAEQRVDGQAERPPGDVVGRRLDRRLGVGIAPDRRVHLAVQDRWLRGVAAGHGRGQIAVDHQPDDGGGFPVIAAEIAAPVLERRGLAPADHAVRRGHPDHDVAADGLGQAGPICARGASAARRGSSPRSRSKSSSPGESGATPPRRAGTAPLAGGAVGGRRITPPPDLPPPGGRSAAGRTRERPRRRTGRRAAAAFPPPPFSSLLPSPLQGGGREGGPAPAHGAPGGGSSPRPPFQGEKRRAGRRGHPFGRRRGRWAADQPPPDLPPFRGEERSREDARTPPTPDREATAAAFPPPFSSSSPPPSGGRSGGGSRADKQGGSLRRGPGRRNLAAP